MTARLVAVPERYGERRPVRVAGDAQHGDAGFGEEFLARSCSVIGLGMCPPPRLLRGVVNVLRDKGLGRVPCQPAKNASSTGARASGATPCV